MNDIETPTSKRFTRNGKTYKMVWETNTLSSPEGATVVVVRLGKKPGDGVVIFKKLSFDHDLDALQKAGEAAAEADAAK